VLEVCVGMSVNRHVNCSLLVSDFNQKLADIDKTTEYQIPWKSFQLFWSILTRADAQSDGRIVFSRRSAVLQTRNKAAWLRPAGKTTHSVGKDKNSPSGCMSTGLPEHGTGVLIAQPRRQSLLKLTPLGYAVSCNDLERLWNEASGTEESREKLCWR
jgi:hypothetical protein